MYITQTLEPVRYVVDANGEKTDVLIPLNVWNTFMAAWEQLIEIVEEQEDLTILQQWLEKRAAGEVETISLDEFEQELIADGLLPS